MSHGHRRGRCRCSWMDGRLMASGVCGAMSGTGVACMDGLSRTSPSTRPPFAVSDRKPSQKGEEEGGGGGGGVSSSSPTPFCSFGHDRREEDGPKKKRRERKRPSPRSSHASSSSPAHISFPSPFHTRGRGTAPFLHPLTAPTSYRAGYLPTHPCRGLPTRLFHPCDAIEVRFLPAFSGGKHAPPCSSPWPHGFRLLLRHGGHRPRNESCGLCHHDHQRVHGDAGASKTRKEHIGRGRSGAL